MADSFADMLNSAPAQVSLTLSGVSQQLVARSEDRRALLISGDNTAPVTVSWFNPAIAGSGLVLPIGSGPLLLDAAHHGAAVKGPINVIGAAGTVVTILEVSTLGRSGG